MKRQTSADEYQPKQDPENTTPSSTLIKSKGNSLSAPGLNKATLKEGTINSSSQKNNSSLKRKALGDITNQEKSVTTRATIQQPAKKIKSTTKTSSTTILETDSQQQSKKASVQKPQLKIPTDESCDAIEYCPQTNSVTDFLEYPTPVFMEFNPETGKAEDVFVTLSDERMKELVKPPTKEEASLPFSGVADSVINLPPSSPMPSAITPISFDDFFNFDGL